MPPKKQGGGGAGSKVVVDKTFGMKNKKGAKAQEKIKVVQQQQSQAGKSREELAKQKKREEEKALKLAMDKQRKEEMALMSIVQPKVPFGVDPKTLTCAFWKAGKCDKGAKCKFAHSDEASRKTQKKDLYTDMRDDPAGDKKNDTMDKWDQEKLDSVILSKHGNPKSTTDKVCKFFLQAVEDGKYGWFWECPNGGEKCMYKHRLPPGFVLKAQRKEQEAAEKAAEISLEEFLELQRHRLADSAKLTPVTPESFALWKKQRMDKREAEEKALKDKKASQAQANKLAGLSGRDMFTLNPDMFGDEEDDGEGEFDLTTYMRNFKQERQEDDEEEEEDDDDDDEEGEDDDNDTEVGEGSTTASATNGVARLSVNGDEGEEQGRRKNGDENGGGGGATDDGA